MSSDFGRLLVRALIESGLASPNELQGCSQEQLLQLESYFGVGLPGAYREFLQAMGVQAGQFLVGTDFRYPTLLSFREAAEQLLKEDGCHFALPPDTFVFCMHQGYVFLYFQTGQGDDPPVYLYQEGARQPRTLSERFSEWLLKAITEKDA